MATKKNIRENEMRMRHKVSVPKIYELLHEKLQRKKARFEIVNQMRQAGFGGLLNICNWTKIPTFFIEFVTRNFDSQNMRIKLYDSYVFPLTIDDVHRVYELPRAGKKINLALCTSDDIVVLRKELGLKGDFSITVKLSDLEEAMTEVEDPKAWVKGAILLTIHNLFCPSHKAMVCLRYAHIVRSIEDISSYNWCSHILDYMRAGLKNTEAAIPLADFHFLLINYIEKMGKDSPFLTGKYKRPALREWNVKYETDRLKSIYSTMGLERGLVAGVISTEKNTEKKTSNLDSTLFWFDTEKCTLHQLEDSIKIYTSNLDKLKEMLAGEYIARTPEDTIKKDETTSACKTLIKYKRKAAVKRVPDPKKADPIKDDTPPATIPSFRLFEDDEDEIDKQQIDEIVDKTINSSMALVCTPQTSSGMELVCTQEIINKQVDEAIEKHINSIKEQVCTQETSSGMELVCTEEIINKLVDDAVEEPEGTGKDLPSTQETSAGMQLVSTQEIINQLVDDAVEEDKGTGKVQPCTQEIINQEVEDAVEEETSSAKGLTFTQETILKFPEYLVPSQKSEEDAELVNLDDYQMKKRKRKTEKENLMEKNEGKRVAKESKYLKSPYKQYVKKSNASERQKYIVTYAWTEDLPQTDAMYRVPKFYGANLSREEASTLKENQWVSNMVMNAWVNCLNTKQKVGNITRLITPCLLYSDIEKHRNDNRTVAVATKDFAQRLGYFPNLNWKNIDIDRLEYIMAPAIVGTSGCHFVCYAIDLKNYKFQYLNSLSSMKLHDVDGDPTDYKITFDVFLKEALSFLQSMAFKNKQKFSFKHELFQFEIPEMPQQPDKDSCGVFCMKFLEEWQGDPTKMKSFKDWKKIPGKKGKIAQQKRVLDMRIELCSSILTDTSNTLKGDVEKKTQIYIKYLREKHLL